MCTNDYECQEPLAYYSTKKGHPKWTESWSIFFIRKDYIWGVLEKGNGEGNDWNIKLYILHRKRRFSSLTILEPGAIQADQLTGDFGQTKGGIITTYCASLTCGSCCHKLWGWPFAWMASKRDWAKSWRTSLSVATSHNGYWKKKKKPSLFAQNTYFYVPGRSANVGVLIHHCWIVSLTF